MGRLILRIVEWYEGKVWMKNNLVTRTFFFHMGGIEKKSVQYEDSWE